MSPDNGPSNPQPSESMQPVAKVCWVCNKETTGPYFEADGTVICLECRQKMKTGKGEKRSGLGKGIAIGGAVLFLLAAGLAYFAVSRLRNRSQPPAPPGASNPSPSSVSTQENPTPSLDSPTPEDTTAAPEGTQPPGVTPTPAGTEGTTPGPAAAGQGSTAVSSLAAAPSPAPVQAVLQPSPTAPANPTPMPSPVPAIPTLNPDQGLSHPVPNALANATPLPNSLQPNPLAKTPNP